MTETLRLIAFPGAPNLPIFAGMDLGLFAAEGIAVELETTPSSAYQIPRLADGTFDVAATAVDNIVAYRAGHGPVAIDAPDELFVAMGATTIELSLVAAPEFGAVAELAGRSLALDAVATGFAFVLYRMLEDAGLDPAAMQMTPVGATPERWASVKDGTHDATLTIEPFTSMARAAGYRVLDTSTRLFSHYQGGVFAARRGWAADNAERLTGFTRGYLAALDWVRRPENRTAAVDILGRHMPQIAPGALDRVLDNVLSPDRGLTPNATLDPEGIRTVLDLRRRYGPPGLLDEAPDVFVDLSYYDRARR